MKKNVKNLSYYLKLKYPITITEKEEDGKKYFAVDIPDLPGCGAHGSSLEEALESLEEAKKLWIEVSLERDLSIPEPISEDAFSGNYLLRIPPRLHMQLTENAKKENLSLNKYMRNILESNLSTDMVLKRIDELNERVKNIEKKLLTPESTSVYTDITPLSFSFVNAAGSSLEAMNNASAWVTGKPMSGFMLGVKEESRIKDRPIERKEA
ncbi:MAG: type II toxin-antitoxin system HicB family antitoxin [Candidatus Aminicenantes bacterium]|nr:type II toxin-antitoxin system HicB family antitoxin [Candidatus Aminicenantes bacterium]